MQTHLDFHLAQDLQQGGPLTRAESPPRKKAKRGGIVAFLKK